MNDDYIRHMRKAEEIKAQREFCKMVEKRIAEQGFLYKHVAKNIGLSESRFSQFMRGFRGMPTRVRVKLTEFLKIS